ncbi:hypothetical protein OW763_01085 [Clostridium aestuarii]|uniref:Uncharacterized protein n=1 Tax=Clostridium aestuarii TaxID=338193 RepID=A0ABT4CVF2_9CLOT|nr:hypothetical protein [Clostridium aestuarii]MCY6482949.1 hypothetical protein [Clostridium aestuarii]
MSYYHKLNNFQIHKNNIIYAQSENNKNYNEIQHIKSNNKEIALAGALIIATIPFVLELLKATGIIVATTVGSATIVFILTVMAILAVYLATDKEVIKPTKIEVNNTTKIYNINQYQLNILIKNELNYTEFYNIYLKNDDYTPSDDFPELIGTSAYVTGNAPVSQFNEKYFSFKGSVNLYSDGTIAFVDDLKVHKAAKWYWKSFNLNVRLTSFKTEELKYSKKLRLTIHYNYIFDGINYDDKPIHWTGESKTSIDFLPEKLQKNAVIKLKKDSEWNYDKI